MPIKFKIILLLTTLLYGCGVTAQVTDVGKKKGLYQGLIAQLGVNKDIPIFYKTSLNTLKRIDLKSDKLKWFDKEPISGVTVFIKQIDITKLSESKLTEIDDHPLITKKYELVNSREQPFLELSPIVYSTDKNLALCSVYHWSNREASSETIYILQLQSTGWKIVRFIVVSLS